MSRGRKLVPEMEFSTAGISTRRRTLSLRAMIMWPSASDTTSAERIQPEQGYNVEQMTVAGMNCWVVSDLNDTELKAFAELIRAHG